MLQAQSLARLSGIALLSVTVTVPIGAAATAAPLASRGDSVDQLAALNPGVSRKAVIAGLHVDPKNATAVDKKAARSLAIARKAISDASARPSNVRSGGGGSLLLGRGRGAGDIFYSPSGALFVTWGHTGLYYSPDSTVEAPGPNSRTRVLMANTRRVEAGAQKMWVNTSSSMRSAATAWSSRHLNRGYSYDFVNNRAVEATYYNCSQFVWAAYMSASRNSIDLDDDGRDRGVYPAGIRDSNWTTTYQTL